MANAYVHCCFCLKRAGRLGALLPAKREVLKAMHQRGKHYHADCLLSARLAFVKVACNGVIPPDIERVIREDM